MRHSVLMLSVAAVLMAGCPKQEPAPAQPAAQAAPAPAAAATAAVLDEHSYAEPGKVRTKDLALDLNVDFAKKQLAGTATYTLDWIDKSATQLVLDTRDLTIERPRARAPTGSGIRWHSRWRPRPTRCWAPSSPSRRRIVPPRCA